MGITDKITGRAKQAAGDLTGDADTRRQGKLEERKGDVKDEAARAEERADRKRAEAEDLERRTWAPRVETFDQADAGYPEEGPPGADPTDEAGDGESAVREKSRPGGAEESGAPDNDDGKATGNPKT